MKAKNIRKISYGTALILCLSLVMISAFRPRPITIFMVGDSTMANKPTTGANEDNQERGWGQMLQQFFDPKEVIIDNHARNGRSSKSFIDERLWENVKNKISPNDYVIIQGGTAFPGAFTYEFRVRPQELGRREQGLVGTGNNQLAVTLMKTGRLRVSRRSANESAGGERPKTTFENAFDSTVKLETGKWARIAVVYDLRKLTLYVNGEAAGSCESKPMHGHEWLNHVILGARCGWVWNPYDNFKGDMAMIRISGRNLAPGEFLK